MEPITAKADDMPDAPNVVRERSIDLSLIERVVELGAARELEEHRRATIPFDEWCRRDAAEALLADRIRRHTLIDDNPSSG